MAVCKKILPSQAQKNWKDEKIELLITLYEERPCFWDVAHKDFNTPTKNRDQIFLIDIFPQIMAC